MMTIPELYKIFKESSGISTDTRKLEANQLFFALSGENFNGNKFALKALESGAAYAVVDDPAYSKDPRCILVPDCLTALQELATHHRALLNIPVLALTGSNGKTTTKELINAVLSTKFVITATRGNLNNHIGVPLTLLTLTDKTEIAIIEMGANHLKEIENLCKIALPNYGYITNFGKAHLEGFGSEEGIIKGKSELYLHIVDTEGLLFINQDDAKQVKLSEEAQTYSFGQTAKAKLKITYPPIEEFAKIQLDLVEIGSNLVGTYNATNMAAAAAIGTYFEIDRQTIKDAIEGYIPANNRSQIIEEGNMRILLDAYNANPSSMEAALSNFSKATGTNKIAILGDMFELGKTSREEHTRLLEWVKEQNYVAILAVGKHFKDSQIEPADHIYYFEDVEDLQTHLPNAIVNLFKTNCFVLIKGSRGMALERLVPFLKELA